ncbi:MAG: flagellar hook-associated protein FlgL [Calditrichia bacterium]
MRITQNYSVQNLLSRINNSRERIYTLQRNLATGKRINQISDDPENIEKVMKFNKSLKMMAQFQDNLKNAVDFMSITAQALNDATDVLAHVKELTVQGSDSLSPDEWNAFAEQIDQMLKQMVDISNTTFKGRYVFGGTNTTQSPFVLSPDGTVVSQNADGTSGSLKVEIGENKIEKYNITGEDTFAGSTDIFQTLIDLRDAFRAQDGDAVRGLLAAVDSSQNQILEQSANLGAKINRFDMFARQYETQDLKLKQILSDIQDTDAAKAITDLQTEETGLQTALQVLAKTLNISLVDYMQ